MEGTPFLSRLWYWMTRKAAHKNDPAAVPEGQADEVGPESYDPPEAYQLDDWPSSEPPFWRHYPSRFRG